jgi:hypothetical protein
MGFDMKEDTIQIDIRKLIIPLILEQLLAG